MDGLQFDSPINLDQYLWKTTELGSKQNEVRRNIFILAGSCGRIIEMPA